MVTGEDDEGEGWDVEDDLALPEVWAVLLILLNLLHDSFPCIFVSCSLPDFQRIWVFPGGR